MGWAIISVPSESLRLSTSYCPKHHCRFTLYTVSFNFAAHAILTLAPPSGYALNLKALIKVSKVSWTSQLPYEILRSSFERKIDKANFISPQKNLPKSPHRLGLRELLCNFLPMKTWKNRPQKLLIIGPNFFFSTDIWPKSLFLFHKNCLPRDLLIMTLVLGRTVGSSCWSTHTFASCYWRNDPVYKIKNGFWKTPIGQSVHAFPISRTPNGTGSCPQVFPAPYLLMLLARVCKSS